MCVVLYRMQGQISEYTYNTTPGPLEIDYIAGIAFRMIILHSLQEETSNMKKTF